MNKLIAIIALFIIIVLSGIIKYLVDHTPTSTNLILNSARQSYFIGCMEAGTSLLPEIEKEFISQACHEGAKNYHQELIKAIGGAD